MTNLATFPICNIEMHINEEGDDPLPHYYAHKSLNEVH